MRHPIQFCRGASGNCSAKNEDARDRSLWRLNGDEPAGSLDHASSHSAFRHVSGLPRTARLPTGPAMELRVAPIPASFGGSVSQAPGRPVSLLLQLRLSMRFRVAPIPASSGLPTADLRVSPDFDLPASLGAQSPGCPGCRTLWPASGWVSGLPRSLCPSATPSSGSPGFPESRTLWRYRFCVFGALRILRLRLGR